MDNQNVYQLDNSSNTLNASISMPTGSHTIYIRAWDKVSDYGASVALKITVGSTSSSYHDPDAALQRDGHHPD